ncbi:MAG: FAD-dependent oxidoreductase [Acidobacteriota bacterium]|nr:FAD-dependent oxidoreductase [Acidobacteriota bacterium]
MAGTTTADLVQRLRQAGVELSLDGERLRYRTPGGPPPAELRAALVRRKSEIAAELMRQAAGSSAGADPALAPLLTPLRVGSLELAHRMVLSPMEVDYNDPGGAPTERTFAHYAERARGGAALVVVEATCVETPVGRLSPAQLRLDDDSVLPALERLVTTVKEAGASFETKIAIQLQHAGRRTSAALTGETPVAPSATPNHRGETPRELGEEGIAAVVERFAEAAARAQLAGFDAVEIHGAHGYLVAQFLSPLANQRQDRYGGSVENRARFLLEIVAAIRRRVGRDFPLFCRLSAFEVEPGASPQPRPGGLTLEDTMVTAGLLKDAGVDGLDLSATVFGPPRVHPMAWPEGFLLEAAATVRRAVDLPVGITSRVPLAAAARAVERGELDMVRLGRALLADSAIPVKVLAGRGEEVRPCIYCNICLDPAHRRPGAVCAVNPRLGHEAELPDPEAVPAAEARTVIVVGGGAAGLEAARVAALRGHRVHLFERSPELGGQLRVPSKTGAAGETWKSFLDHLVARVEASTVTIHRGRELDAATLAELDPDAVLLATGAAPLRPAFAGDAVTAAEVLDAVAAGSLPSGPAAVVGAGLVGCETALRLAEAGLAVTLVGRRKELAASAPADHRMHLAWALKERGVTVLAPAEAVSWSAAEGRLEVSSPGGGETVEAATLVLAAGAEATVGEAGDSAEAWLRRLAPDLAPDLDGPLPEILTVGDARAPRNLTATIHEAYRTALVL